MSHDWQKSHFNDSQSDWGKSKDGTPRLRCSVVNQRCLQWPVCEQWLLTMTFLFSSFHFGFCFQFRFTLLNVCAQLHSQHCCSVEFSGSCCPLAFLTNARLWDQWSSACCEWRRPHVYKSVWISNFNTVLRIVFFFYMYLWCSTL